MKNSCIDDLVHRAGIAGDDALALRRISMTLHRWHELECGDSNEHVSRVVVRGRKDKGGAFEYDEDGKPYLECHDNKSAAPRVAYFPIADKERGALRRLKAIIARYPGLQAYVQGDPRGASLYILRPGDVPEGADVSSCYNRGIAVYR